MTIDHHWFGRSLLTIPPAPVPRYSTNRPWDQLLIDPQNANPEPVECKLSRSLRKLNSRQLKKRFQNHVR